MSTSKYEPAYYTTKSLSLPAYLEQCPEISQAAVALGTLLANVFRTRARGGHGVNNSNVSLEIEGQFGKIDPSNGYFVSGVSKEFFNQTIDMMDSFKEWIEVSGTEELHDYFYTLANGTSVRTTTKFATNEPVDAVKALEVTHMTKTTIFKQDLKYESQPNARSCPLPSSTPNLQHQYDIRITARLEECLHPDDIPKSVLPTKVRIKQRKTFYFRQRKELAGNTSKHYAFWAFDLTRSWTGTSKEDAENKQKTEEPVYEVEYECLDPDEYMKETSAYLKQIVARCECDEVYLATSLLMKMIDMFGDLKDFTNEPSTTSSLGATTSSPFVYTIFSQTEFAK